MTRGGTEVPASGEVRLYGGLMGRTGMRLRLRMTTGEVTAMGTPARRESRTLLPDLFDLIEPFTAFRRFSGEAVRVEDCVHENEYVVRAELPGIDPDRNLELSVTRGILTIRAERHEDQEGKHHSEFRYGSYERQIRLPENVKDDEIRATYDKGILTITMPLEEVKESTHRIPVEHTV